MPAATHDRFDADHLTSEPIEPIEPLASINESILRVVRISARARADATVRVGKNEVSTIRFIATLIREGPMRMTALAAATESDLSTVSRQVSTLVRDEFIDRQPDPADGRACLLVPTEAARARFNDHIRKRTARLGDVLADWTESDRRTLAILLTRLTDDLEQELTAHESHPEARINNDVQSNNDVPINNDVPSHDTAEEDRY